MEPLIQPGSKIQAVMVNDYKPHLQDVVIFRTPADWGVPSGLAIKRVLGVPGDHVSCSPSAHGAHLLINGRILSEPYLPRKVVPLTIDSPPNAFAVPSTKACQQPFSVVIPAGDIWLMGDNRGESSDSRYHLGDPGHGAIPAANVIAIYKRG